MEGHQRLHASEGSPVEPFHAASVERAVTTGGRPSSRTSTATARWMSRQDPSSISGRRSNRANSTRVVATFNAGTDYGGDMMDFAYDFTGDGWPDILSSEWDRSSARGRWSCTSTRAVSHAAGTTPWCCRRSRLRPC